MAIKLLILVMTMVLLTESHKMDGKLNFRNFNVTKFLNRLDPFSEPENTPPSTGAVGEGWVTQRLDNFNPTNTDTWQQRFMMNGEHFQPGGCIFIFLAGTWAITEYRLENSLMEDMAEEFKCYIFYLEHRYYGESKPTPDVSDKNLRFLTVDQALADTAHFIEYIKSTTVTPGAQESPVIVIGGHYSGSLAAFFRQSYPHLVIGAWASSAPTLAIADNMKYKELTGAVYRHVGGNKCYQIIERGFAEMEQMIADGRHGELVDMFHLCDEIEHQLDVQTFFLTMSEFYSLMTQFQIVDIQGICDLIADEMFESDAEAIAQILVELLDDDCLNVDYEFKIERDRQTNWEDSGVVDGYRQHTYQLCTQLGWFHSSLSRFQPFGSNFPVELMFQACEDVFGDLYSPQVMLENIVRFNSLRGGVTPAATNVLYVHGQHDPWRTIGVQSTNHEDSTVIVIQGASQSNDLGPLTEEDSDELKEAKLTIKEIIFDWIRRS